MSGKVFEKSSNVYEDQATVLFHHLRQVAEAVVAEEEAVEKKQAVSKETVVQLAGEIRSEAFRERMAYGGAVAALVLFLFMTHSFPVALIIGLLPAGYGIASMQRRKAAQLRLEQESEELERLQAAHKAIRRDYRVHKLGAVYVPVARRVAFEGRQFLIDCTDAAQKKEFRLNTVRQGELFANSVNGLRDLLREAPLVEQAAEFEEVATDQYSSSIQNLPMYDYLGKLDRGLRQASFCLEDLETTSVSLPVIMPQDPYARFLMEFGTSETGGFATVPVFDTNRYDSDLAAFQALNQMKMSLERQSGQFERVLRQLMVDVAGTVQALAALKMASTIKLVETSNRLLFTILKAPYNHYSPRLEAEEIERIRGETFNFQDSVDAYVPFQLKASSRVLFDPISEVWLAEDGSRTATPFGLPQIHEEIVAPMVQTLMKEHRVERLKIYNAIKDQKINYLNQWHQDVEKFFAANRTDSTNLISQMRSSFTEFIAACNSFSSLEQTESQMSKSGSLVDAKVKAVDDAATLVAAYDAKRRDYQAVQDDFAAYMERLKEDIDRRAEQFGYIEYYDASVRDAAARAISQSEARKTELDARRLPLLAVNPHFAEASELPPVPSLSELAATHSALNLQAIARNALADLDSGEAA